MKSIIEKKLVKRKFHKRLIWLILIFILSIFALKSLMEKHPVPVETQSVEDLQKATQVIEKPQKMLTVAQKKQRFKDLLVPAIDSAYAKLVKQYKEIKELINKDSKNERIERLKKEYKAKSNHDLLLKLKPHPKSVTLAQAAIESAWGTSRFFYKANNVFGVWSFNKSEPRIPAGETRGTKTIYLKKYRTIEDSVLDYYKTLAKGRPYHKFRVQNYTNPNPYKLVTHLDSYSEKRAAYGKILISVIGHNKFVEYDDRFYPRPPKPKKKLEPKVEPEKKPEINVEKAQDTNTRTPSSEQMGEQKIKEESIDINTTKSEPLVADTTNLVEEVIDKNGTSKQ